MLWWFKSYAGVRRSGYETTLSITSLFDCEKDYYLTFNFFISKMRGLFSVFFCILPMLKFCAFCEHFVRNNFALGAKGQYSNYILFISVDLNRSILPTKECLKIMRFFFIIIITAGRSWILLKLLSCNAQWRVFQPMMSSAKVKNSRPVWKTCCLFGFL